MRHKLIILALTAQALVLAPVAQAWYSGQITPGNPLAGHPWYVDTERGSWFVALRENGNKDGVLAAAANNPMGKTFGSWVADPRIVARNYILRAEQSQPGSIPFINLARIESRSCPYTQPPGFTEKDIDTWVKAFSEGIGNYRVMVIVETDKLTTIRCLPRWAQARRYRELSYEVHLLHTKNPNAIVYMDAGAANWGKSASTIARWLRKADVAEAQGFSLNTSHHDWTSNEDKFGLQVSKLLHGKHFVVNTNSNGWGPKPHGRTAVTPFYHGGCTPPGEGLGYTPTVATPNPHIDAYIWSGTPGYEDGNCLGFGAKSPYAFYLQEALSLATNANPKL